MNKKITASLCAILILLAGCKRNSSPDLVVSPENPSESVQQTEAVPEKAVPEKAVEVRKKVDVLATQNPCWVKVGKQWINITAINTMRGRHSIDEYGVILYYSKVYNEVTRVFIETDNPEGVIDEIMNQTKTCKS